MTDEPLPANHAVQFCLRQSDGAWVKDGGQDKCEERSGSCVTG